MSGQAQVERDIIVREAIRAFIVTFGEHSKHLAAHQLEMAQGDAREIWQEIVDGLERHPDAMKLPITK